MESSDNLQFSGIERVGKAYYPRAKVLSIISDMTVSKSVIDQEKQESQEINRRLLLAVVDGDRDAFEQLYTRTINCCYSIALRVTGTPQLAEEAVSDAYMQIWQQAATYTVDRGSVLAWISIICRSRALDLLRKESSGIRKQLHQIELIPEKDAVDTSLAMLESAEKCSALHKTLMLLNDDERQLLALAYFRGYSHNELAELTGKPLGTVKAQLHRSVHKLRKMLIVDTDKTVKSLEGIDE